MFAATLLALTLDQVQPAVDALSWPPDTTGSILVTPSGGWDKVANLPHASSGVHVLNAAYGDLCAPYVAPYRLRITTLDGVAFWLVLADFKSGGWRIHGERMYGGTSSEVELGLSPNAVDAGGHCCFAVLDASGSPLSLTALEVEYPVPAAAGQPLAIRQYILARDGTPLATTVYLPLEHDSPFLPGPPYPAILMRTPYRTEYIDPNYISLATRLNCAVVAQYFRGRPAEDERYDTPQPLYYPDGGRQAWPHSGGAPSLYRDHAGPDNFDALDTVAWIEGRNWYNGKLLLTGPSGLGLWIYQAAPALGSRVSAIYPQVAAGNIAEWAALQNGCVKLANIEAWLSVFNYPPDLQEQAIAECSDRDCWEPLQSDSKAFEVRCQGFHETCWWDVDVEAGIASWRAINEFGGDGARGRQWLLIGPWEHGNVRGAKCGALLLPTDPPECDATHPPLRWEGALWAARILGRNPLYSQPERRVLAYFIGEQGRTDFPSNHWVELEDWPPRSDPTTLFLTEQGGLVAHRPNTEANLSFNFDATNPVPSLGGANIPVGGLVCGPLDQSPAESHEGVLKFRSALLEQDLCIAGYVNFGCHVSCEAGDCDVIVKLTDIYPQSHSELSGASLLVCEGSARLSAVCNPPYRAGDAREIGFTLGQRAYVFGRGHRIGLTVQASSSPRLELNPAQVAMSRSGAVVRNTLHISAKEPAFIRLPIFRAPPDALR